MQHKTLLEQLQNKCIHFNGVMNEKCKAGIKYKDVRDESFNPFKFPCIKGTSMSGGNIICAKQQFPTEEQAKQIEKKLKQDFVEEFNKILK